MWEICNFLIWSVWFSSHDIREYQRQHKGGNRIESLNTNPALKTHTFP